MPVWQIMPRARPVCTTKANSKLDEDRRNSDLVLALSGDHREGDRRRNLFSRGVANHLPPHRLLDLRAMWRGLCSLSSRIAVSQRNNGSRFGICLESLSPLANGRCDPQHEFRCVHTRGSQKVGSTHPAPTPWDFYILARTIDRDLFAVGLSKGKELLPSTYDSACWGPHRKMSL